jgi:hypothetical protein
MLVGAERAVRLAFGITGLQCRRAWAAKIQKPRITTPSRVPGSSAPLSDSRQNVMVDADLANLWRRHPRAKPSSSAKPVAFPVGLYVPADVRRSPFFRQICDLKESAEPRKYARSPYRAGRGNAFVSAAESKAVAVNIKIIRAFVKLRRLLDSNAGLARKLEELERQSDGQFKVVFDAIRALMNRRQNRVSGSVQLGPDQSK